MNWITILMVALGAQCPNGMKLVGVTCVDEFEAPNIYGVNPIAGVTAFESEKWCANIGKRLCTIDEWEDACEGIYDTFPEVPNTLVLPAPAKCNNDKDWLPVNESKIFREWSKDSVKEINRLYQAESAGFREGCVSSSGVHDLIGNVEEWVISPKDPHGYAMMGHHWTMAAKSCSDRTTIHVPGFFYYTSGTRCCKSLFHVNLVL